MQTTNPRSSSHRCSGGDCHGCNGQCSGRPLGACRRLFPVGPRPYRNPSPSTTRAKKSCCRGRFHRSPPPCCPRSCGCLRRRADPPIRWALRCRRSARTGSSPAQLRACRHNRRPRHPRNRPSCACRRREVLRRNRPGRHRRSRPLRRRGPRHDPHVSLRRPAGLPKSRSSRAPSLHDEFGPSCAPASQLEPRCDPPGLGGNRTHSKRG
mmetsp:Transcript_124107/g.356441  ORF Transcript_124107/g.356441 Transcript_124107/m.356441 type:complete len:209 (-) Transcript_124107:220-846(-)